MSALDLPISQGSHTTRLTFNKGHRETSKKFGAFLNDFFPLFDCVFRAGEALRSSFVTCPWRSLAMRLPYFLRKKLRKFPDLLGSLFSEGQSGAENSGEEGEAYCQGGTSAERTLPRKIFFDTNFLIKNAPIFPRFFWAFILWVRKNPANFPPNFPPKNQKRSSPTSFCKSAGRTYCKAHPGPSPRTIFLELPTYDTFPSQFDDALSFSTGNLEPTRPVPLSEASKSGFGGCTMLYLDGRNRAIQIENR